MIESKIIFKGEIDPKDIVIRINKTSTLKIPLEIETEIESTWEKVYKESNEEGRKLYNGKILRLDSFDIIKGKLEMTLSKIDFKTRVGIIENLSRIKNITEDNLPKSIAIGGLVKTKDNKYIFGINSGKTMNKIPIDIIGGMIEPKTGEFSSEMIFDENYRELKEELNVDRENVKDLHIIGLILTSNAVVMFFTSCVLNITVNEVQDKFKLHNDGEVKELLIVDPKNLNSKLNEFGGYKNLVIDLLN